MADDPAVLAGTLRARWMLNQSEAAMDDILAAFELMKELMLDGELISPADLSRARTALANSRSQLIEEVNKHERRILLSKGLIDEAPIDFDAIRDQVGRSLDRIRDARDAEGVPERADE